MPTTLGTPRCRPTNNNIRGASGTDVTSRASVPSQSCSRSHTRMPGSDGLTGSPLAPVQNRSSAAPSSYHPSRRAGSRRGESRPSRSPTAIRRAAAASSALPAARRAGEAASRRCERSQIRWTGSAELSTSRRKPASPAESSGAASRRAAGASRRRECDGGRAPSERTSAWVTLNSSAAWLCLTPRTRRQRRSARPSSFMHGRHSLPAYALPWMKAATRSAIMIVGALVLPPTRVGMTEASTTRRPSTPRTRQLVVDHRHRRRCPGPSCRCRPGGRSSRSLRADPRSMLGVGLDRGAGLQLLGAIGIEARLGEDLAAHLHAGDQRVEVARARRGSWRRSADARWDRRSSAGSCRGSRAAAGRRAGCSRSSSAACGRGRSTIAGRKWSWMSGAGEAGRVRRKPPDSAMRRGAGPCLVQHVLARATAACWRVS